jgi:hypothetical protein
MRRAFRILMLLAPCALGTLSAPAAVFQYTVPVESGRGQATAFLWIPPEARQIRGVVMSGMTLAEREMSKDPQIRKACAEQQLAILFQKTGLGGPAQQQKVLDDFARVSGYRDLSVAPLFFFGHSAGGPPAKSLAIKLADRCFGVGQYRGGVPGGKDETDTVPPGVPSLMMVGQFDEFGGVMRNEAGRENPWESGIDGLIVFRAKHEQHLGSIAVEPGAGHFAWSERNGAYLALFIQKAAQARIPDWPADAKAPVTCKAIAPGSGWLTSLALKTPGDVEPAPEDSYKGDKAKAAWHFDEAMARATVAYHAGIGRKDQFIRWTDPVTIDAGARYFFTQPKWVGDGQTLEVHPFFLDKYPADKSGGGQPRWHQAGQPAGYSTAPIQVKRVGGPLVPTGPNTLRLRCDGLAPAGDSGRYTFMAYSVGDAEYRHTEQVGMIKGFTGFTKGKDQTITFPPVGNLKAGGGPVTLKAASDADLPVEYYVAYGPAVVEDGQLKIADLPARATFPIEVKVVAYQFGRGVEPFVKTAAAVEQVIKIDKP